MIEIEMNTQNGRREQGPKVEDKLLTVKEAAKYLGCSAQNVYIAIRKGRVFTEYVDSMLHIRQSVCDSYRKAYLLPTTDPTPEPEQEHDPHTNEDTPTNEVGILNAVISRVFTGISPQAHASLVSMEEVKPTVRVWNLVIKTDSEFARYTVTYDGEGFIVNCRTLS